MNRRAATVPERASQQTNANQHSSLRSRWSSRHEFSDLCGKLGALPLALQATGVVTLAFGRRCPGGPDRVGRSAQLVGSHMRHRDGLAGGVRRLSRSAGHLSSCGVRGKRGRVGLLHPDLTPRPGPPQVDRPARTIVLRPCLLEVMQHMLRAVGRSEASH